MSEKTEVKQYKPIYLFDQERNKLQKFPSNSVKTTKYHWWSFLPVFLVNQFKYFINFFFLTVAILACIPQLRASSPVAAIVPICIMLLFSTIRELFDEFRKYKADKKLNKITYTKLGQNGEEITIQSNQIYSGDILILKNNSRIPADGIPLHTSNDDGVVFIETAELDGETNLKQRLVPSHFVYKEKDEICQLKGEFNTTESNPNFESFVGTFDLVYENQQPNTFKCSVSEKNFIPNGCTIRNTEEMYMFVVYCGKDTKLSKNLTKPRIKFSHTNKIFNKFVGIALVFDFLVILVSTILYAIFTSKNKEEDSKWYIPIVDNVGLESFLQFFSFLNMYSFLVPVSCLVSLEFSKTFQMFFIAADEDLTINVPNAIGENERKKCMPWTGTLNDEMGLVEYVLSDKTGTLTENQMKFMKCSIDKKIFEEHGDGCIISELGNSKNLQHSKGTITLLKSTLGDSRPVISIPTSVVMSASHSRLQSRRVSKIIPMDTLNNLKDEMEKEEEEEEIPNQSLENLMNDLTKEENKRKSKNNRNSQDDLPVHYENNSSDDNDFNDNTIKKKKSKEYPQIETKNEKSFIAENILPNGDNAIKRKRSKTAGTFEGLGIPFGMNKSSNQPRKNGLIQVHKVQQKKNDNLHIESIQDEPKQEIMDINLGTRKQTKVPKPEISIKTKMDQFLKCMAICHEAVPNIQGESISYQSGSPDEVALCEEACLNGYIFNKRTQKSIQLVIKGEEHQVSIEAVFPFDSNRKRMSVLVRLWTGEIILYIKGADLTTLPLMAKSENVKDAQEDVNTFAREGYRTLVFGYKKIDDDFFRDWMVRYDEAKTQITNRDEAVKECIQDIEHDFCLLGVSAVEDKLQIGVPETIQSLRRGGIRIWMITGDKVETAINIAHTCGLTQKEKLVQFNSNNAMTLIREGAPEEDFSVCFDFDVYKTIGEMEEFWNIVLKAKAVICCRVTPMIKGEIMKNVKLKTGKVCLGIGDGGNDIPLIKESDVGIGIFGKEGTQAAQTSDYAIRKFRHLQKLIFFHGRQALRRNTIIVKLSFYKNVAFILMQFWFGIQNHFSGTSLYEDMIITLFNMVMTSMPPVFIGAFEIDIPFFAARDYPEAHREVIEEKNFTTIKSYVSYILLAIYQSVVIYVLSYVILIQSDVLDMDGKVGGFGCFNILISITAVITILITMALSIKSWNWPLIAGFILSFSLAFICILIVCYIPSISKAGLSTNSISLIFIQPSSYLFIILTVAIATCPAILKNVCSRMGIIHRYHIIQEIISKNPLDGYGKDRKRFQEGSVEAETHFSNFCRAKSLDPHKEYDEIEMHDVDN